MRSCLSVLAVLAMLGPMSPSGALAITVSCKAVTRNMCSEYTVPDEPEAATLWKNCQKMGGTPTRGANCAPAPTCTQQGGTMLVTTYDYEQPADQVRQSCILNGGRYNGG